MAKPSGIKITDAIDRLAQWFCKEGHIVSCAITYDSWAALRCHIKSEWSLWIRYDNISYKKRFTSFTSLRNWMESEIKRQRILFRRF